MALAYLQGPYSLKNAKFSQRRTLPRWPVINIYSDIFILDYKFSEVVKVPNLLSPTRKQSIKKGNDQELIESNHSSHP